MTTEWRPDATGGQRSWLTAIRRGFACRCPQCGGTKIYFRYLKINQTCLHCGLELGEYRSDDAPPYFTILIVGHLIVPSMLILEQMAHPAEWVHAMIWPPLTVGLALWFLPRVKGAVIGLQWANNIRG